MSYHATTKRSRALGWWRWRSAPRNHIAAFVYDAYIYLMDAGPDNK